MVENIGSLALIRETVSKKENWIQNSFKVLKNQPFHILFVEVGGKYLLT